MTQAAMVDGEQLAVLRRLRRLFGIVEVLEVRASAPAPARHFQGSLIDRPPAWTTSGHPGACPFCGSTHVRWTWKPDQQPTRESVRCYGCGWVETRPFLSARSQP